MPGAQGDIAYLKAAEKRASQLIADARDERKSKLREAQAEAKREIDALRAEREARLRAPQPGAAALEAKVAKVTAEVERSIAGLAEEYKDNKEKILTLILKMVTTIDNPFAGKK